ncbi:MAG: type I 3-dehydroquinate dehydratase, partial [Planctomycetota bacterium]
MLRQRLEVCRARAAWIELRLDRVEDSTAALVAKLKKLREDYPEFRWVAACRFASQESEQIRLLEAAGEAGVDFVDQPLELQQSLTLPPQVHRIHSWHQEGPGGEAP